MLRRVERTIGEDWIVGGDFNAILNDAEKKGGCRKARSQINEFKDLVDELALVDIKPNKGWVTWVNNRDRNTMIKERLDRFFTSVSVIENFPFMATYVVRQTNSDHDAIVLDTWGRSEIKILGLVSNLMSVGLLMRKLRILLKAFGNTMIATV